MLTRYLKVFKHNRLSPIPIPLSLDTLELQALFKLEHLGFTEALVSHLAELLELPAGNGSAARSVSNVASVRSRMLLRPP